MSYMSGPINSHTGSINTPPSVLLLNPASSNPENGVTLMQHYPSTAHENAMQVIGRYMHESNGNGGYGALAIAQVQERLAQMKGLRRERAEESGGEGGHFLSKNNSGGVAMGGARMSRGVSSDSMRELEDLLTKLNPLAKEFVPPPSQAEDEAASSSPQASSVKPHNNQRKKNGFNGKNKKNSARSNRAQREDSIRRTVYVSDIDQQVTEEQLAALFITCGQVVDCRVCGDPNSVLRFAFVEFTDEEGARNALNLAGTVLGYYPVRVLPSKTAIVPVNPTFLPRSEDERELCARTIYCTNIDKKVTQADVKLFFESLCGEVARLRLLGDYHHSTRIAFVEFIMAESAMAALNCSGAILGSLPIRVSPSKTPVRPRTPRPPGMH